MARMIPEIPREFDPSSHEATAFQALSRLPDDYYVFHSLSLVTINQRNFFREREIDFLVVNQQKGILCIEVKAGSRIHHENGQWCYSNGTLMPHDGPYKQAESAKHYLMSAFDEQQDNNIRALKSKCKFLHAVWFLDMPRSHFSQLTLPTEADRRITLCGDDLENPTPAIERIFRIEVSNATQPLLDGEFRLLMEKFFAPRFDLIPTPKYQNQRMLEGFNKLLAEQTRILDFLEEQPTAVINGAAGTGKTMIAVEKARRNSVAGEKVLFLCYNRLLRDNLDQTHRHSEDASYNEQFGNVDFYTISGLAQKYAGSYDDWEGLEEWLYKEDFPYKHVIIDEGQDFALLPTKEESDRNVEIIDELREAALQSGGTFYLFYDRNQAIQGERNRTYDLPSYITDSDCRLTLYQNCRNTSAISQTSLTPLQLPQKRWSGSKVIDPWSVRVEKPVFHLLDDESLIVETVNKVLDDLQAKDVTDIVLLTVGTMAYTALRDGLESLDEGADKYWYYCYKRKRYRMTTAQRFKGLEATAIIMVDLKPDSFAGKNGMVFYVGASRAKLFLDFVAVIPEGEYKNVIQSVKETEPVNKSAKRLRNVIQDLFHAKVEDTRLSSVSEINP